MPRATAPRDSQILKLYIVLLGSEPPIWRRFEVPDTMTLGELHYTIQLVMPWTNSHLHEFLIGEDETRYAARHGEMDGMDDDVIDEESVRLSEVLTKKGQRFAYIYDFGDNWEHGLEVEEMHPPEKGVKYPICLEGERACPPDDSGGLYGYYEMLEILNDPEHEEYETYREWLPRRFNPEAFDVKKVNRDLNHTDWLRGIAESM